MNGLSICKCNNPQNPSIQFFNLSPETHSTIFLFFNLQWMLNYAGAPLFL